MPKKTDSNQKAIVSDLRRFGASVAITSMVGKGFPDIVVGFRGKNYLFEIKDENKPPSARKLTPDEAKFHLMWCGDIYIIKNINEVKEIMKI